MLRWCLVCVICNSNSFHFFIVKLCIMIVHSMNTFDKYFFHFGWLLNLDIFFHLKWVGVIWFVYSEAVSILYTPCKRSLGRYTVLSLGGWGGGGILKAFLTAQFLFMFKLCIMIVYTLKICTYYFVHLS